jgi:hypothetical protein
MMPDGQPQVVAVKATLILVTSVGLAMDSVTIPRDPNYLTRLTAHTHRTGHQIPGPVPLENRIQLVTYGWPVQAARVFVDQTAYDGVSADPFSAGAGCPAGSSRQRSSPACRARQGSRARC